MRGTVAKRLRRAVYGDHSQRDPRYTVVGRSRIVCVGLRAEYKQAKKNHRTK